MILLALTFYFVVSVNGQKSYIVTCEPGDVWVREHVRFECLENPETGDHGFRPFECISPESVTVKPETLHSEGNFKYQCVQDDPLTLIWDVISCYTPNRVELAVGAEIAEGDGTYACTRDLETGDVNRIFGKKVEIDERTVVDDGIYKCSYYNDQLQIVPIGCHNKDGSDIGPFQTLSGEVCEVRYPPDGPLAFLKPLKAQCTDHTGVRRDIGESWRFEDTEYKCDVIRGVPIPKLTDEYLEYKARACFKDFDGYSLKIWINQAAKAKNGKFYWCKPVGNGPGTKYVAEEIPVSKTKCGKRNLLKKWVAKNNFCKCAWVGEAAETICFKCVSNDRKQISKNRIYEEKPGEAYVCEPSGVNQLTYRKLTPKEYDLYNKGYRVIGDVGDPGSGLSWRDNEGNVVCADGYVQEEDTCVDENECQELTHTCNSFERCKNTKGSFVCYCKYGTARNSVDEKCDNVSCGC